MTVQTNTNVANFNGDGANKNFPIGYKFNSAADLVVTLIDDKAKTTQILTLNSDFTVTGAGDEEGGVVALAVAPTLTQRLKATRIVDILQLTDLRNQGKFYAEIHEDAFDLLTMIAQQHQTEIGDANDKADYAVATSEGAKGKVDDLQQQYADFTKNATWQPVGDYADSPLIITSHNQYVLRAGIPYRLSSSISVPYTTTGDWATESGSFVLLGDDVLRQELSAAGGAGLVRLASGRTVDAIRADDVSYLSPLAGAMQRHLSEKLNDYLPSAFDFGAVGDGATDDSDAIQGAIDLFGGCYLPYTPNGYAISKPLYLATGKSLIGPEGLQVKIVKTTNAVGEGSNTVEGGVLTDSYAKDAVLIVRHADLAYATYVEVRNILFTSTANCEYVVYAPRMYVGAFRNVLIGMTGGKYGFYTNKTFMFSMDDVQVAGNNSNIAGSVGFWWDDQATGASGTSISFNRCWVRDGVETGYKFRGLVYTTLTACGTDRFLKNAFWAELCDITLNGFGFENRLSTTGGDALVFRYSRIVANGLVSFSVNIGAGFFVINHTGGLVQLNGLRHTATVAGGTSIRVADNATMIRSGAAFATQVTDTPVFADATAHITTIGNGITAATAILFLGASGSQVLAASTGSFRPVTDNSMSLGTAGNRFTTIYAGNGTINTSDERSKCEIKPIEDAVFKAWGRVEFMQYKFRDAVELKGDGARWHFGVIAQRVKEAFEAEGLDAFAYGLLCYDEWPEEPAVEEQRDQDGNLIAEAKPGVPAGSRYGIRYEEALALECAYLRSRLPA